MTDETNQNGDGVKKSGIGGSDPVIEEVRTHFGKKIAQLTSHMNELESTVEEQQSRIEELESMAFKAPGVGTKKDMVKTAAKYLSLKAENQGPSGGALRYNKTKGRTETLFDTSISPQTVYDSWDDLAREYDCYSVEKGRDGSEQLRITKAEIPEALRTEVETFKRERFGH